MPRVESPHPLFGEVDSIADSGGDTSDRFREDGYVVVRRLLSLELVQTIQLRCDALAAATDWNPTAADPYRRAFQFRMNGHLRDRVLDRVVRGRRLAEFASRLLEVPDIRLSHDNVLYKPGGADTTPIHADQFHWPVSSDATVTAWIPLQATSAESGSLQFYRGSHSLDTVARDRLSGALEPDAVHEYLSSRFPLDVIEYTAGDVSFHRGWTFHRAFGNSTSQVRRAFAVVFMDAQITIVAPRPSLRLEHLCHWCPNARVGGSLDDERNPVVFQSAISR